jgi:hypothetical protein
MIRMFESFVDNWQSRIPFIVRCLVQPFFSGGGSGFMGHLLSGAAATTAGHLVGKHFGGGSHHGHQ